MEKTIRYFRSAEAAEASGIEEDLAMAPEQRIAIVCELQARIYPDAAQHVREFIELLTANGVEFLVVGGFAVAWHGLPRFTADLDFLIRPDFADAERVVNTLRQFGFGGLRVAPEDLCRAEPVLQLGVKPNRIDLRTSIAGLSFEEAWAGKVAGTIDDMPVSFIGCDALSPNKEAAGRPQDLADAYALRLRSCT